ncbi:MAG: DNA primase [Acidobacteriia bacterium]|nr:DNA primase [Terriglobia bacterium]
MSQVDEVRAAADIVKIVGDYVKLRKAGANFVGLCPFHQEKTPSFAVHPTKQIFHCFGCGVGGDVFKFVMLIDSLSFPEALRRVAEKAGVRLREAVHDEASDASARERAALHKIHEVAAKFYASQLGATAEGRAARAYLADRGLSDETVGRFLLGYAPSDGQALTRRLLDSGFETAMLEKSGLVLRDSEGLRHFDRFRRRIIFPIARESGKTVAFGGRALGDDQPKYLNSPETAIYTKSRVLYNLDRAGPTIRKLDYAILVEGYMDCIAVASAGIENVVASCGTSLTESQVRLLGRYSRRVVVNYDPDSAGVAATERSLSLLLEEGFEAKVLALPGGLDPDSFIRRQGANSYRELLAAAPTYLDYLTERAASAHDLSRPEGKVAAANAVMPYLVRVPNAMLRAELANRLAERLRLDDRLLREELRRASSEGRRELQGYAGMGPGRATPAEKKLLRAFFEDAKLADEFLPQIVESKVCEGQPTAQLFKQLWEWRQRGEKLEAAQAEAWQDKENQHLVFESLFEPGQPPDRQEVMACIRALHTRRAERERDRLQAEIQAAEREKDQRKLVELLEAKAKIDKELRPVRGS